MLDNLAGYTHLIVDVGDFVLPDNPPIVYRPFRGRRHPNSRHECRKDGRDLGFVCLQKLSVTNIDCDGQ